MRRSVRHRGALSAAIHGGRLPAIRDRRRSCLLADRLDSSRHFSMSGSFLPDRKIPSPFAGMRRPWSEFFLRAMFRLNLGRAVQAQARAVVAADRDQGGSDSRRRTSAALVDFLFERVRHYVKTVHALRDDVIECSVDRLGSPVI